MEQTWKYIGLMRKYGAPLAVIADDKGHPFTVTAAEAKGLLVRNFSAVASITPENFAGFQAHIDAYINLVHFRISHDRGAKTRWKMLSSTGDGASEDTTSFIHKDNMSEEKSQNLLNNAWVDKDLPPRVAIVTTNIPNYYPPREVVSVLAVFTKRVENLSDYETLIKEEACEFSRLLELPNFEGQESRGFHID